MSPAPGDRPHPQAADPRGRGRGDRRARARGDPDRRRRRARRDQSGRRSSTGSRPSDELLGRGADRRRGSLRRRARRRAGELPMTRARSCVAPDRRLRRGRRTGPSGSSSGRAPCTTTRCRVAAPAARRSLAGADRPRSSATGQANGELRRRPTPTRSAIALAALIDGLAVQVDARRRRRHPRVACARSASTTRTGCSATDLSRRRASSRAA